MGYNRFVARRNSTICYERDVIITQLILIVRMVSQNSSASQQHLDETEIKRRSVRGVASYFVRTVLLNVVNLLTLLYLSSKLGPEEFGIYGLVTQLVGLLIFASDVGLAAALVQKKKEPERFELVTAFTVQQALSWLIVFVCVLLAYSGIVSDRTGQVGNWILLALAVSFPLAGLKTIPSILLERKLQYSKLVIPQIGETLLYNAILVLGVWQGFGAMAFAFAILARSIAGVLIMFVIQPWMPALGLSKQALPLFKFGAAFQLNDLLARIKDQFYYVLVGYYFPLQAFGYIQWAKNWSMYPYNLTVQNVMAITFPTFSRLQHNPDLLRKAIEKTLYFISFVTFPMLAGLVLFFIPLMTLHPSYAKWQPAVLSLGLFCFSVAWGAVSTPLTNALAALGKMKVVLGLMTMWTILTWTLTPFLLWRFGTEGVAVTAAIISFTSILPVWFLQKYVSFTFWEQIWRQCIATIVMIGVTTVTLDYWSVSYLLWICGILLSGVVYVTIVILLGPKKARSEFVSLRRAAG